MLKPCCSLFFILFSLIARSDDGDGSLFGKYLSGFRQEHHFSLIAGQTKGAWKITRFGNIQDKSEPSEGIFTKARYSFHLPLIGPFGYALGTSLGVLKHLGTKGKVLSPKLSLQLPSFFLAGIYQVNSRLQFILGLESYLERVEGIEDRSSNTTMDATMIVVSDQVFVLDYFYDLGWAVRIEYHRRQSAFQRIGDSDDKPEDAKFRLEDRWLGIGILYHLI